MPLVAPDADSARALPVDAPRARAAWALVRTGARRSVRRGGDPFPIYDI